MLPRPLVLLLVPLAALAAPAPPALAQSPPRITLQAVPAKVVDGAPIQVAVTIEPQGTLQNVVLKVEPPPGLQVDRSTLTMATLSGKVVKIFRVQQKKNQDPGTGGLFLVSLETPQGAGKEPQQITSETLKLDYAPEIPVSSYVALGMLGVALGYGLRLLLKVLQSIPPQNVPAPAPPAPGEPPPPQPGPITRFVQEYYYLTDFLVTLGLGFLALIALTKAGHPPETGNLWYTALAAGVGIGLLTNSELLTRVGAKR